MRRSDKARNEADRQVIEAAEALQIHVNISDTSQISCQCRCETRIVRGRDGEDEIEDNFMRLYTASNYDEFIICRWFFRPDSRNGGCKTALMSAVFDEVPPMENSFQPGLDHEEHMILRDEAQGRYPNPQGRDGE